MRKIINTFVILLLSAYVSFAGFTADIGLSWNNNPDSEFITKYIIYQAKLPSTNFVAVVSAVGTNYAKVRVTSTGTYQFKVSAVNGMGESGLSTSVQVPNVSPSVPSGVSLISVTVTNQ